MRKKLVIGERSTEHTRVPEVELKKDMIFVNQEKRYYNGHDTGNAWAVKETRTHVFRTDDQVKAVKPIGRSSPLTMVLTCRWIHPITPTQSRLHILLHTFFSSPIPLLGTHFQRS